MRKFIGIVWLFIAIAPLGRCETDIMGVKVYNTLEELVDTSHTAVLVIDMQNATISTEGVYARADKSAQANPTAHKIRPEYAPQVQRLSHFLDEARKAGVLVVYLEFIQQNKLGKSMVPASYLWRFRDKPWMVGIKEDTWEAKTISELAPRKGDLVFTKYRENSFHGTMLHEYLTDRKINSLLLTGTSASRSLFLTAVGAYDRGCYPVWVKDCLFVDPDQDQKWMDWLKLPFPMHSTDEIAAVWKKMKDSGSEST